LGFFDKFDGALSAYGNRDHHSWKKYCISDRKDRNLFGKILWGELVVGLVISYQLDQVPFSGVVS
jgi:hypothetical protein